MIDVPPHCNHKWICLAHRADRHHWYCIRCEERFFDTACPGIRADGQPA